MKIIDKPTLPKEIFAVPVKPELLSQAVRVYLANHRQGTQNAKTRAEINRTRHKLYKQKGTGGARHGDRRAPIFIGGGITFAPKPREYSLNFPDKMKRKAILGALSFKAKEKKISVVSGLDKLTGKTSELVEFLPDASVLIVTDSLQPKIYQAARNIPAVTVTPFSQLNTYEILRSDQIFIMEEVFAKPKTKKSAK